MTADSGRIQSVKQTLSTSQPDAESKDDHISDRPEKNGPAPVRETGGPPGPEPTRFGDWEKNGRCIDF